MSDLPRSPVEVTSLSMGDKVVILGATGWFGQTMHRMLQHQGISTLLVGSSERQIQTAYGIQNVTMLNWKEMEAFEPTVVCDFAFLTREHLDKMSLEKFETQNRNLLEVGLRALSLNSVKLAIATSSGAAVIPSSSLQARYGYDPYSKLKQETESRYLEAAERLDKKLCVVRPYSVSGDLVTKPRGFALSDFISQAITARKINIESRRPVLRRYCDLEDLLTAALLSANSSSRDRILESGGELVDLEQLAFKIGSARGGEVSVVSSTKNALAPDSYHSDNLNWSETCSRLGLRPLTLTEQISKMITSFDFWGA